MDFAAGDWILMSVKNHLISAQVVGYEDPDRIVVQKQTADGKWNLYITNPHTSYLLYFFGMEEEDLIKDEKQW